MPHIFTSEAHANLYHFFARPIYFSTLDSWLLLLGEQNTIISCPMHGYFAADAKDLVAILHEFTQQQIVQVNVNTDVFSHPALNQLESVFDRVQPYKLHYIYDPERSFLLNNQHRFAAKKAREHCQIKIITLANELDNFQKIYEHSANKLSHVNMPDLPLTYFHELAKLPQLTTTATYHNNTLIGINLWFEEQHTIYHHLGLYNELGHQLTSTYAVFSFMLHEYAAEKFIDFGGSHGIQYDIDDHLLKFKKAFANASKMSYHCSKTFS